MSDNQTKAVDPHEWADRDPLIRRVLDAAHAQGMRVVRYGDWLVIDAKVGDSKNGDVKRRNRPHERGTDKDG